MRILRLALLPLLCLLGCCLSFISKAASVQLRAQDANGAPLAKVVLAAVPLTAPSAPTQSELEMRQEEQQFIPDLLVIQRGARVAFPNLDVTRHHVYSFSAARRFELKLYLGDPAAPVHFDTAGIVTLGCNIHDWMLAHIAVVDTPYFGVSDTKGNVQISLPAGAYTLWAWHPDLGEEQSLFNETIQVNDDAPLIKSLKTEFVPEAAQPPRALGFPSRARP